MKEFKTHPIQESDRKKKSLVIALPEPGLGFEQDAEWCVIRRDGKWKQVRFHDYAEVYEIPGMYERLFYDVLKCTSPATVCSALEHQLEAEGVSPRRLCALDLGAGNGMVGNRLKDMGIDRLVGVDIIEEAAAAAERDRPGLYDEYLVADMAHLPERDHALLDSYEFNCLTCVAALGFGDIPCDAFAAAYNLVRDGGWIAFNIKTSFLDDDDSSGFSELIRTIRDRGIMEVLSQRRYRHRLATNGEPLHYVAIIGRKKADIPESLLA